MQTSHVLNKPFRYNTYGISSASTITTFKETGTILCVNRHSYFTIKNILCSS